MSQTRSDYLHPATLFEGRKKFGRHLVPVAPVPPEGGYNDEIFLFSPPKDLQCIICFLTVRDPHLIACCGATICKLCMIRSDAGSECPQCRDTSHLVVPDKKTKGQTMSLKVKCTNGDCEWRGELVDYNNHITDKCLNRVVQCQYGCGLYFMASEVSVHEKEECTKRPYEVVVQHYEKLMGTLQTKQQQQMRLLEEKHKQAEKLTFELEQSRTIISKLENKQTTFSYITEEFPRWYGPSAATSLHCVPPCIRAMTNLTMHKLSGDSWYSPPFYTGPGGYKLQLVVDIDGSSTAKGTHVLVFLYLMKGENDDCLGWPFKGSVTVKLLNWMEDRNHLEHTFSTTSAADPQSFKRVTSGVRASDEMYQRRYIAHKELEFNGEKNTHYVMKEVLCFVISSVEVLSNYQPSLVPEWAYPELSKLSYGVLPAYRTIEEFNHLKRNNEEIYSDHFYTSQGGYKLTLCVYPNGNGSWEGTHVSVYISLIKGENDENLSFPISGIFTVQLLNWKQNNNHHGKSLMLDESTPVKHRQRVTSGERADVSGYFDYLSHAELESSDVDREYLYEDKMCFRIEFEPILQTGPPVPSWCDVMYTNSSTPPCTRTLYNYTTYKKSNSVWWSQPFYNRDKGYKLLLRVYANGGGPGKGTHLSLFVNLLKGEYDDKLQWPFNANITVQLLNWSGDNGHKDDTIPHYKSRLEYRTRVTKGDRSPFGRGYSQFISHFVLESVTSDVKFVNDNNICFKIIKVNIID